MDRTLPEPAHYRLDAWKSSMRMVRVICEETEAFPDSERCGLTSQLPRSAIGVPSNIAEGVARGSSSELIRFLQIARARLIELDPQVRPARDLAVLDGVSEVRSQVLRILAMLSGLIKHKREA